MSTEQPTDDRLTSVIQTLENSLARTEASSQMLTSVGKMFESGASVVAWQVAVVSPGFLGLLWNAQTLADNSRLTPKVFAVVFGTAELCFLAAIISSVILHSFLMERSLTGGLGLMARQTAATLIQRLKSVENMDHSGPEVRETFQHLSMLFNAHDETAQKMKAMPWYVGVVGRLHGWATLVGYLLVGVIIGAMKLS